MIFKTEHIKTAQSKNRTVTSSSLFIQLIWTTPSSRLLLTVINSVIKLTCCSVVWGVSCSSHPAEPPRGYSGPASQRSSTQGRLADSSASSPSDPEEPEPTDLRHKKKEKEKGNITITSGQILLLSELWRLKFVLKVKCKLFRTITLQWKSTDEVQRLQFHWEEYIKE